MDVSDLPYRRLAAAIIAVAVEDFSKAYCRLKKHPDDQKARSEVKDFIGFVRSPLFDTLTDNIDGDTFYEKLTEKLDADPVPIRLHHGHF